MLIPLRSLCLVLIASAASVSPAWAQLELQGVRLTLPVRYDTRVVRESGALSKDRLQYQLSLRTAVGLLRFGEDGRLGVRSLVGTGERYTGQWNTVYDRLNGELGEQHVNIRQLYTQLTLRDWRLQLGVIPPVKGKVSNTSIDRDGWIRGARAVAPLPFQGRLELVSGAIDRLDDPNPLQSWEGWNYAEVEWTQAITAGWRTEAGYVYLDRASYLRAEVRRAWRLLDQLPVELAAEGLRNVSTPNWAFDVSAQVKARWVTTTVEYSHIPQTFGLLGSLSNDFFALGHLGLLALKGPIGLLDGVNWFSKMYLGETDIRVNAGLAYTLSL